MKVFITGGTGFIGTHTVKRLAQTEHELHCLVRKTSDTQLLRELGATLVTGDVTDRDSLLKGMKGCDWVVNMAALYSFWEPDRGLYRAVNVEGTQNVMECALDTHVSKVVHVSTVVTYGKPADRPFTEDCCAGSDRFSHYAQTKYEGDLVAWELYEKRGLPLVMVYPSGVVGPGDPKATGQYVQNLVHGRMPGRVLQDSIITFVHVRDVAEAIVRALEKEGNIGEKYFVCAEGISMRECDEMISEISGVPLPKLTMPDWMVVANAKLLTGLANLVKKPPMLGMSTDQIRTMKEGFQADGSKATSELGITYTPVRVAFEEAIESYQE
jgi:dihydroflavonol-4-reductase